MPVVGGAIASLIGDLAASRLQHSHLLDVKMLTEKLTELEDRLDLELAKSSDVLELTKQYWSIMLKTNRELKLIAATNILANAFLKTTSLRNRRLKNLIS